MQGRVHSRGSDEEAEPTQEQELACQLIDERRMIAEELPQYIGYQHCIWELS